MCLGIPLKIIEINSLSGIGEINGIKRDIRLDLTPKAKVGDYVMVHAGFAIEIMREDAAKDSIEAILEVYEASREDV